MMMWTSACVKTTLTEVRGHNSAPRSKCCCRLSEEVLAEVASKRTELTQIMWSAAGIVRHKVDMTSALPRLTQLYQEAARMRQQHGIAPQLQELLNLVTGEQSGLGSLPIFTTKVLEGLALWPEDQIFFLQWKAWQTKCFWHLHRQHRQWLACSCKIMCCTKCCTFGDVLYTASINLSKSAQVPRTNSQVAVGCIVLQPPSCVTYTLSELLLAFRHVSQPTGL